MEIERKPHPASPSPVAGRSRRPAETPPVPDGFIADGANQNMLIATREVYVSFVPRNSKRESQVLLFPKGTVTSFDGYQKRLAMYEGYSSLEVK